LVVVAIVGYRNLVVNPAEKAAADDAWKAEQYAEIDSLNLAIEGDGLYDGFTAVIDNHPGTKAASRAHFYLGSIHRDRGEFQEAIDHFKSADLKDENVSAMAMGNIGDCLIELGNIQEGATWLEKAGNAAQSGSGAGFVAPIYLQKAAIAYMDLDNDAKAEALLKTITEKYPESQQINDAKKYLAMLEAK
ncbi:MAG: tetratricopeptide repeat protein, partial [Flavobacteriales bacterium]